MSDEEKGYGALTVNRVEANAMMESMLEGNILNLDLVCRIASLRGSRSQRTAFAYE
jgi:hypothetical protein